MGKRFIMLLVLLAAVLAVGLAQFIPWQNGDGADTALPASQQLSAAAIGGGAVSGVLAVSSVSVSVAGTPVHSAPVATASAPAAVDESNGQSQECREHHTGCACGENPADLHITLPKGMKLVKFSCYVNFGTDYYGQFLFEGEDTVTGNVSYEFIDDEIMGGNILGFKADSYMGFSQFSSAGEAFNFKGYDKAIPKLHPPEITPKTKSKCWIARATLKVRAIEVVDGGSDQDGTWATDFDVLQIGKYKRCKRVDGELKVLDIE